MSNPKKQKTKGPFTTAEIKNFKPEAKAYKRTDGRGLYLLVTPNGSILWRLNYRYRGKQKTLALGQFGEGKLLPQEARRLRDEAHACLANGVDPGAKKRMDKLGVSGNSFSAITNEWLEHKYLHDVGEEQSQRTVRRLEKYALPFIGDKGINEITTQDMLAIIRPLELKNKIDTAHRVRIACDQIFRYAGATGRTEKNPANLIRDALRKRRPKHLPSRTDPASVADLLQSIYGENNGYQGRLLAREALILGSTLFFRPGEIRGLQWSQINLDKAELTHYPAKQEIGSPRVEIIVPLPRQLVDLLKKIKPFSQGSLAQGRDGDYVFPGIKPGKPMSDGTLNKALRSMGIDTKTDFTGHGFRAMARTLIRQELPQFRVDVIEMALSHTVRDPLGRAYNRTDLLAERREMLQAWADYLDELRKPGIQQTLAQVIS